MLLGAPPGLGAPEFAEPLQATRKTITVRLIKTPVAILTILYIHNLLLFFVPDQVRNPISLSLSYPLGESLSGRPLTRGMFSFNPPSLGAQASCLCHQLSSAFGMAA
jgi:hypothetical protein